MNEAVLCQSDACRLPLGDQSVHSIVTSPPYWGLRDYGQADQLGAESVHDCLGWAQGADCETCYVCHLRAVARELWRVLRDDGTFWLNLGDAYASAWPCHRRNLVGAGSLANGKREARPSMLQGTLKEKDLCGGPWRVALALQADGWTLRSDIVWAKQNGLPESVKDRPTRAHEYVFLLSKRPQYFYDALAIAEPAISPTNRGGGHTLQKLVASPGAKNDGFGSRYQPAPTRNARDIWSLPTEPTHDGQHFAKMPTALARRCILAGTSAMGVCRHCGAPLIRQIERQRLRDGEIPVTGGTQRAGSPAPIGANGIGHWRIGTYSRTQGWEPTCACPSAPPVPARVLDPFCGSGTTCLMARSLGRLGIGGDLNLAFLREVAQERLGPELPLFARMEETP